MFPLVVTNKFHIQLAQTLCYTTIAVIGLNILLGLSGQMSLGQAGFYAIGAYGSALLIGQDSAGRSATACLRRSLLAGLARRGSSGWWPYARAGIYLTMATLAFGFIAEITVQRWTDLTGGTMGVLGIPASISAHEDGRGLLHVGGGRRLSHRADPSDYVMTSRIRRKLLAIKENESAAQTTGFNVPVWRTTIFALSSRSQRASPASSSRTRTPTSTATPSRST